MHTTSIPPRANETYSKQTQTFESGTDSIPARRGGGGRDYYTMCFDDPEELYEEDSLPGKSAGQKTSAEATSTTAIIKSALLCSLFIVAFPEVAGTCAVLTTCVSHKGQEVSFLVDVSGT